MHNSYLGYYGFFVTNRTGRTVLGIDAHVMFLLMPIILLTAVDGAPQNNCEEYCGLPQPQQIDLLTQYCKCSDSSGLWNYHKPPDVLPNFDKSPYYYNPIDNIIYVAQPYQVPTATIPPNNSPHKTIQDIDPINKNTHLFNRSNRSNEEAFNNNKNPSIQINVYKNEKPQNTGDDKNMRLKEELYVNSLNCVDLRIILETKKKANESVQNVNHKMYDLPDLKFLMKINECNNENTTKTLHLFKSESTSTKPTLFQNASEETKSISESTDSDEPKTEDSIETIEDSDIKTTTLNDTASNINSSIDILNSSEHNIMTSFRDKAVSIVTEPDSRRIDDLNRSDIVPELISTTQITSLFNEVVTTPADLIEVDDTSNLFNDTNDHDFVTESVNDAINGNNSVERDNSETDPDIFDEDNGSQLRIRPQFKEGEYEVPKIVTTEFLDNTVTSEVEGREDLPNTDFKKDFRRMDSIEDQSSLHNVFEDNTINLTGELYFQFGKHYLPAHFKQNSDGLFDVSLSLVNLCDFKNDNENNSLLIRAICDCINVNNDKNKSG